MFALESGETPARETAAVVTSHSSPAAGAPTLWIHSVESGVAGRLVHTQSSRKGLSSVSRLLRRLERRHILTLVCMECSSSDSPQNLNGRRSWNYFIAEANVAVRGRRKWDRSLSPACQQFIKALIESAVPLLHSWLNQQHQCLCTI